MQHVAGEDAVIVLKARYVKYGKVTPKQMIKHLRDKTCFKMTTLVVGNSKKGALQQSIE